LVPGSLMLLAAGALLALGLAALLAAVRPAVAVPVGAAAALGMLAGLVLAALAVLLVLAMLLVRGVLALCLMLGRVLARRRGLRQSRRSDHERDRADNGLHFNSPSDSVGVLESSGEPRRGRIECRPNAAQSGVERRRGRGRHVRKRRE
jgi:hypothetical protein